MPTNSIVQLCVQFYDKDAIDAANLLVHECCADSTDPTRRYRRQKGDRKKNATMEDTVGLLHRRSDALTVTFAAVDLANLPPVSFDSLDVCALLARVDSTKAEMDLLKQSASTMSDAITAPASVCDDLRLAIQGIVHMKPVSASLKTAATSMVKESPLRYSYAQIGLVGCLKHKKIMPGITYVFIVYSYISIINIYIYLS